jgi:hypothetical protein
VRPTPRVRATPRPRATPAPRPIADAILEWNAIAIQADATDHSGTFGPPNQGGPTRSSRAQAIVHAAMFDAANSVDRSRAPYLTLVPGAEDASLDAAVGTAAHRTLVALYPNQRSVFDSALQDYLARIPSSTAKTEGIQVGQTVATAILQNRSNDGSDAPMPYTPVIFPPHHREDPLNPGQGFLGSRWGEVRPFVIPTGSLFRSRPISTGTAEYTAAFNEVKRLGGDGVITPTQRTQEQTFIGLYWAYDGTRLLGTPPRLYNQITRVIAQQRGNTVVENARLFALINLAMADAGIACWESKFFYDFWRPILGIRESDPGTGPTGQGDGNPNTIGDVNWTPLGAPNSNNPGSRNFTPPFPAYPSGHATFGASLFRVLSRFYGTDNISFTFVSDELNGVTTDNQGNVRPLVPRTFHSLSSAAAENAQSRIYLGIHWQFDATSGITMGNSIGDFVFNNALR